APNAGRQRPPPPCAPAATRSEVIRPARLVELRGFEPLTFSLRTRRATNCATAPDLPVRLRTVAPQRPHTDSSSARSSAVGSHPPASALAWTWSALVTPAITEATAGWAANPPT